MKKYVMQRTIHLGGIRTTVRAGTIITHDEEANTLVIDGKVYDSSSDLDILKDNGWATPFDQDEAVKAAEARAMEDTKEKIRCDAENKDAKRDRLTLPIEISDSDSLPNIDISHTKTPIKQPKVKRSHMEIIRGEEDVMEVQARAETVIPVIPIIRDDSLGVDDKTPSMNAGTVIELSPERHEQLRNDAIKKAQRPIVDPRLVDPTIAAAQNAVDSVGPEGQVEVVPAQKVARKITKKKATRKKASKSKTPKKGTVESIVANTAPGIDMSKL